MAAGEEKEALTLEKVLFTVLEATPENLASLEKVRKYYNSGLISYVYTHMPQVAKPMKPGKKRKGAVNFGLSSPGLSESSPNQVPGQTMYQL